MDTSNNSFVEYMKSNKTEKKTIPDNCGECILMYNHCYEYCLYKSDECIQNLTRHHIID